MDVYLIRHTQPLIEKGICYGATDLELAPTFLTEANAIKSKLPPYHTSVQVVSSPLIRCKKLAEMLAPTASIKFDNSIKEMSFGDWELKPWNSIDKNTLKEWYHNFVQLPPPNGESYQQVYDRAIKSYLELISSTKESLWLITHSGIIRAILSYHRNSPLKMAFKEQFEYGVVFQINKDKIITKISD